MTDLERAYAALRDKASRYDTLYRYYDGDHPTVYATKRLAELFRGVDAVFTENWCAVVVDSVINRLHLDALGSENAAAETRLQHIWDDVSGDVISGEVHESLAVTGEAFVLAWRDAAGITIAHNDPRLVHVFYEPGNPLVKRYAAKWWVADDETLRLVLYYRDRLEYFRTRVKVSDVSSAAAFEPDDPPTGENPWNVIPVFHFRRSRRVIKSELVNVIPLQNGINKLAADMMVAAEYGAFKQRYVISQLEALGKLRNAPNEIWHLPAGDGVGQGTVVGEFSATDLKNYLDAIENLANTISTITGTPKHFFFQAGGTPSGEALITEEAPLVAKVLRYQRLAIPVWQELGAFILDLLGFSVPPQQVLPRYAPASMVQPRTQAEITKMRIDSGVPLAVALAMEGYSKSEIEEILAARDEEIRRQQMSFGQALAEAERRRDALRGRDDD